MKKLSAILIGVILLASLTGCAGIIKTAQESGYLDGIPNLKNKDIADVIQLAEAFGLDPNEISLGQFMGQQKTAEERAKDETVVIKRSDLERLLEQARKAQPAPVPAQ